MPKNRVFVTGGNGFVGSRVVRRLIEKGNSVVCLLRETSRTDRIDDLEYQKVIGDVRDLESLVKGMDGCTGVVHLAGLSSWDDIHSPLMREVVVQGTGNVLRAAEQHGELRTVHVSSVLAVGGTKGPVVQNEASELTLTGKLYSYSQCKKEVEELCLESCANGLPVIIVNPAEVYGPNDRDLITSGTLVDFAKSNPTLITPGGASFVYVDDVAEGIVAALEKGRPGERYILGGDNITHKELARTTLDILGKKHIVMSLPRWVVRSLAFLGRNLHVPLPFNPAIIPYAVRFIYMDNTKARQELGVEFRSIRETLEPTLAWLSENGFIN